MREAPLDPWTSLKARALPLVSRLRRGAPAPSDVLEEAERQAVAPVICLPGQLARATAGVPGFAPLADEIAAIEATELAHMPLARRVIRNALVHEAGVDAWAEGRRIGTLGPGAFHAPRVRLAQASYPMTRVTATYFGHWLTDACRTALLSSPEETLLLPIPAAWPHASEYCAAFGFPTPPDLPVFVDRLTIYDDVSTGRSGRARIEVLRSRLLDRFGASSTGGLVYLRRGLSGARRLISNEADVINALSPFGVVCLDVEGASVETLVRTLAGARLVVSIEGSHQAHAQIALAPGAGLLSLIPADRFSAIHAGMARARGLAFGLVVIEPGAEGYRVDLADLTATVEQMVASPRG